MMKELLLAAEAMTEEEYQRAAAKFAPKNNSPHESFAVLLEEVSEMKTEQAIIDKMMDEFWEAVMSNSDEDQNWALQEIKKRAILSACESIQVAAMAHKALMGYDKKEEQ